MNLFDLTGKRAFLSGAKGNLGPIWVETLEDAGVSIFSLGLPEFDITNKCDVNEIIHNHSLALTDYPDILINNAAIDNPPGSNASFFGNFKEIIDVNLIGAINMCEAVIPLMIKNGGGVIVNIGSIMGNVAADYRNYPEGFEKPVAYNCSKAALIQLSRSITVQYGRYGIRSVTISFGPYDGGKLTQDFLDKFLKNVPLNRTISKESFQQALLFACCCPELAGTQVLIDGGYTAW